MCFLSMSLVQGISALPSHSANLFHWTAKIEGLVGTIWEGGYSILQTV